jgi:hypothetical protein
VGSINDHTVAEVSVEGVGPLHGDGGASGNSLDVWRDLQERVWSSVASNSGGGDILNWAIVVRKAHVVVTLLHNTVDTNLLEDGVGRGTDGHEDSWEESLHQHVEGCVENRGVRRLFVGMDVGEEGSCCGRMPRLYIISPSRHTISFLEDERNWELVRTPLPSSSIFGIPARTSETNLHPSKKLVLKFTRYCFTGRTNHPEACALCLKEYGSTSTARHAETEHPLQGTVRLQRIQKRPKRHHILLEVLRKSCHVFLVREKKQLPHRKRESQDRK